MTDISRRRLLEGTLAGGAIALTGVAQARTSDEPKQWDATYDVIVIGSGFAGLAAALEAKKAGANVVVLEKMVTPGGNSIINGGILTATGCPQQKMHGIEDSPELLEKDILAAGLYMNYMPKVRLLAQSALSNYEWTIKELGVEYLPDAIGQEGGHSVPRYVTTKNGSGSGIVNQQLKRCKELGIPVQTKCFVEHIIRAKDGRVVGLEVREGYKFPKKDSGKTKFLKANKGVVLCYGGFAADVKYRMYQDPKLSDKLDSTNQPGATSERWRETSNIGALQVQNDWVQCGPWGNPREKGLGIGWMFNQTAAAEYGIWVNSDGVRFINELANRKIRADAIMVEQVKGKKCWAVANEPNVAPMKKQRPGFMEKMLERKLVEKFDTIEEMAKACGVDPVALKKTIEDFNGYVKAKKDPVLGRYINNDQVPMTEGPWYIGELSPKVHHCMGGLVTDMDCHVIDVLNDEPIPGLYAAGVRLGSVAILDCLVFGRIAGTKAAKGA